MKSITTAKIIKQVGLLLGLVLFISFSSCKKDDPIPEDPIASFQYVISSTNFLQVTFSNFSQNATSYSWDFGDGRSSIEENPVHTYNEAGEYIVVLTAKNSANVTLPFSQTITITDPDLAYKMLTGEVSKTWKLYRVGTSMSLGESATDPAGWWAGLQNNGARPCLYKQEFTFHFDGTYVFDDKGEFWGEHGVWGAIDGFANTPLYEICFPAVAGNMVNAAGADVKAWLSGTHAFTYNPSAGTATLTGEGAWIGIPKLGTTAATTVPSNSVTFKITITKETGYDLMKVVFDYGAAGYWPIVYVSYSDPSLEPALVIEEEPWGEDLEDITPTALYHTFESETSFELLGTIGGTSPITTGVDDPTDATATKVGKFDRIDAQYQEAQLRISPDPKDIQFDNFTNAKIDIFIPADTDFTTLKRHIVFGFADLSQTQEWWNSPTQFVTEGEDVVLGAWNTYTFDLTDVKARTDIDMIFLGIGGGGHTATGTFYVRNLIFE